jgi:hypothetical protein
MPVSGRSILLSAALLLGSASFSVATAFNCTDDLVPHSDAYNSGDYGAALKEVEPISDERCPEAEHLCWLLPLPSYSLSSSLRDFLLARLVGSESMGARTFALITTAPIKLLQQFAHAADRARLNAIEAIAIR